VADDRAQRRDLPALDGFRGLAAVSVISFHLINTTAPVWFSAGPPELVRNVLHHLGVDAVIAFFVLSGFLVARPFLDHLIDDRRLRLGRYARARSLRILPAWWVVLLVVLLVSNHPVLGDPRQLLLLATLQHSYDQELLRNVIPPAWTLVIEVSFYVAMPLLLLAARRPLARFHRRTRIGIVGALLVASVIATMWLHRYWLDPDTQPHPDLRPFSFALPVWWDAFAFGMLAALAIAAGRGQVPLARELRYAALVPALAAWEYFGDPGVDRNTLFAGACALAIVGIAGADPVFVTRALALPALRRIGWWSYGMYLWHLPIQYALVRLGLIHHDQPSSTWIWLPVMLLLATTAGWLSYRFVEAPLLLRIDRRDWWRPGVRRPAAAGV
jgi:peptidoglycan/LPS O-acetylase OafA/YrhL